MRRMKKSEDNEEYEEDDEDKEKMKVTKRIILHADGRIKEPKT
jgi:hypothetical protein